MKNNFATISLILLALITLTFSCADPTTLGSELQDQIDVAYADTLTVQMSTISETRIKTYDVDVDLAYRRHLCGNYTDQIMGTTSASIFTQMRPSTAFPDAFFDDPELDSVILHLTYDSLAFYGNRFQEYDLSVFRLIDDMDVGQNYYSDDSFASDPTPLGSHNFQPKFLPLELYTLNYDENDTTQTETFEVVPQLRIKLNDDFGNELLGLGRPVLDTATAFLEYFPGLHIKSTSQNEGMLGFVLNTPTSGLTVYYTKNDTSRSYTFAFNSVAAKTTFIETDFTPELESAFDSVIKGDSLVYIQGLAGPNIKIDFPYAEAFKNTIINKAELILTVASEDDLYRRTPNQVVAATRDADGTYLVIDDVLFSINRGTFDVFGGQLEENNGVREYRFNLSAVFQELVDGENEPIFLRILPKQEQITRMTLYGPGHSLYPARFSLVYTKLSE